MNILFIGAGHMGRAIADGLSKEGVGKNNIFLLDPDPDKNKDLKNSGYQNAHTQPGPYISQTHYVVLAIKPQVCQQVLQPLLPYLAAQQVFVSIMAGTTAQTLSQWLPSNKIIRIMPNLPISLQQGVNGLFATDAVTVGEVNQVKALFDKTGLTVLLDTERGIDAITALSGSGPAFVFYFLEAWQQQAAELGFSDEASKKILLQTFRGTLDLFEQHNLTPTDWMNRVASKGGTTRAGLNGFDAHHVKEGIKAGVKACFDRSLEMGK